MHEFQLANSNITLGLRFGPDQVRLVPVEEWSHAKGLSTWRVPAPDFASEPHLSFGTQEEVSEHSESLWCRNGGPLAPTMFPPCNPEANMEGTPGWREVGVRMGYSMGT